MIGSFIYLHNISLLLVLGTGGYEVRPTAAEVATMELCGSGRRQTVDDDDYRRRRSQEGGIIFFLNIEHSPPWVGLIRIDELIK